MNRVIGLWTSMVTKLESLPYPDVNLFARLWIAQVFYLSGRTKAGDGYLTVSDSAVMLFEYEYALPIISAEVAAQLALYMETFLPLMLIIGIGVRFSGFLLLGMTAVIQLLVLPSAWPDHLLWAAVLILLIQRGGGKISIDHLIRRA